MFCMFMTAKQRYRLQAFAKLQLSLSKAFQQARWMDGYLWRWTNYFLLYFLCSWKINKPIERLSLSLTSEQPCPRALTLRHALIADSFFIVQNAWFTEVFTSAAMLRGWALQTFSHPLENDGRRGLINARWKKVVFNYLPDIIRDTDYAPRTVYRIAYWSQW